MSIVIFNPASEVFERYINDREVVFYNGSGWWIFRESERVCVGFINDNSHDSSNLTLPVSEIMNKIRQFGPLWSRWMARGDQFELLYRDALFNILEINRGLSLYGIKLAIFNSGVPHHISTMIFEIACVSSNVKQVFLYTNNIMLGRLLPLIQEKSVADRRPLSTVISDKEAVKNIERFVQNKLDGGTPESGGELPTKKEESLIIALLDLGISFIKNRIRPLKYAITRKKPTKNMLNQFYNYSSPVFFSQLMQQYSAMSFYKKNMTTEALAPTTSSEQCRLLIAAHFQPEATSFPEGWDCHNNVDIVLELRRLGFQGDILYKEHPATFMYRAEGVNFTRVGMYRSRSFYEQLLQLGCSFIDPSVGLAIDSERGNYLPVTITGTIAIERSLAGLHTIVTGHPWYKGLPGTILLADISSLSEIKEEWIVPSPDVAKNAFKFLDNILNKKTMINTLGFGIDKIPASSDEEIFFKEFDALLSSVKVF